MNDFTITLWIYHYRSNLFYNFRSKHSQLQQTANFATSFLVFDIDKV